MPAAWLGGSADSVVLSVAEVIAAVGGVSAPDDLAERTIFNSDVRILCSQMIIVEPITINNLMLFRDVRLRALQDAPSAFGSTYAHEIQLSEADWVKRTMHWSGERGIGFLAMDGNVACGLVGTSLDAEDASQATLLSMWTAPTHRQRGVGRLLVGAVVRWASQRGAQRLRLMVTSNNRSAILFYKRLGFTLTGRTEPYPHDSSQCEYEMSQSLPLAQR